MTEENQDAAGKGLAGKLSQLPLKWIGWAVATVLGFILAVLLTILGVGSLIPGFVIAAGLFGLVIFRHRIQRSVAVVLGICVLLILWRSSLTPSNERDWQERVSRLPSIELQGDILTIKDVRNFQWKEDDSHQAAWETRTYHMQNLRSVDMVLEPFPYSALMAHTMLSFDFGEEGRIVLTIEARMTKNESYRPISGGLNRYELIYVFADEKDAFLGRAMAGHELYSFPARADQVRLRAFFLSLCATANNLHTQPRFYHIIRDNCTTAWLRHSDHLSSKPIGLQRESIFNGLIARFLHKHDVIDTDLPYEEAKTRFRIDQKVVAEQDAPDFSARIRSS